jgi:hypothetical protein
LAKICNDLAKARRKPLGLDGKPPLWKPDWFRKLLEGRQTHWLGVLELSDCLMRMSKNQINQLSEHKFITSSLLRLCGPQSSRAWTQSTPKGRRAELAIMNHL